MIIINALCTCHLRQNETAIGKRGGGGGGGWIPPIILNCQYWGKITHNADGEENFGQEATASTPPPPPPPHAEKFPHMPMETARFR